jgi:thiamine-phosphate pyrophosphorylase
MKKEILRLIDANINRITEGLRVVEEVLRFVYKEDKIYKTLRSIRHKIVKLFDEFYPQSVLQRASSIDPGRTAEEKSYKNIRQLVVSNFHRVTESFRVLEEIAKLVNTKKNF